MDLSYFSRSKPIGDLPLLHQPQCLKLYYVPHESIYKDNGESRECVNSNYEYGYEILIFTNFIYRL